MSVKNNSFDDHVKWLGSKDPEAYFPQLANKNVCYYKKCILEPLTLSVGDDVLIFKANAAEPDTIGGCEVAKILIFYELFEECELDRYRAIVQWYSRPEDIPHKEFDSDDICLDFSCEVIQDHRPYDNDISLKTIYRCCNIMHAKDTDTATEILEQMKLKTNDDYPMFVCRYKLVKVKKFYRLMPLNYDENSNNLSTPKSMKENSMSALNKDAPFHQSSEKVSPIKIVGGRSVVRLSISAKKDNNNSDKTDQKGRTARRNLNLDSTDDQTTTPDLPNYSIVKLSKSDERINGGMKIKLRRSSSSNLSEEDIQLRLGKSNESVKKLSSIAEDIYSTPAKRTRRSVDDKTPVARRKSILKSASAARKDDTPKRNIQLSNIVEQRIFKDNDIICTPKRVITRRRNSSSCVDINCNTPKKTSNSDTPREKLKAMRSGELTPTIEKRHRPISDKASASDLHFARAQLHVSAIPTSLPCREKEFHNIYTFLEGKIQDQCGGCIYVSGVPGTGKTATVTSVVRMLQKNASENKLPRFEYLEINGMRLTEPRQAYVQIYKQLTGKTLSCEHAHSLLEKRFTTAAPRRIPTVLLVDELDILCNRRQDVVYNLLDWPTKSAARLVVITIANTMDLPERLLMGKVTSRLGLTRLTFQPYSHKQLQEIVTHRLQDCNAFKGDAVQLVARKVAAVSGDARRALDICRRATEIAETSKISSEKCVNIVHVQQALAEMIASAKVQVIKKCSRLEQIFLQAVAAEVQRTGVEEISFFGAYSQIEAIATLMGVTVPTPGCALRVCSKLGAARLLICEHSRNDIYQKILLNISPDDIYYALRIDNNNT